MAAEKETIGEKIECFLKENEDNYHWKYNFYREPGATGSYDCFSVITERYITFIISIFDEGGLYLLWNDGNIVAEKTNNWEDLKEILLRYLDVGSVVEW